MLHKFFRQKIANFIQESHNKKKKKKRNRSKRFRRLIIYQHIRSERFLFILSGILLSLPFGTNCVHPFSKTLCDLPCDYRVTFSRCQMSLTYSSMVLSEENLPQCAVCIIAMRAQRFSSRYAASTFFCASL